MTNNAVLTKITGPGTPGRGDGDLTPGADLWTGRAAGYLKRVRRTARPQLTASGGEPVQVRLDIFTILDSVGAPVLERAGQDWEASTVTIEDHRTSTMVERVFTVTSMEHRAAGTIADSVRLELENA